MRIRILFLLCVLASHPLSALDQPPKREFRGAWIATVANLDWPRSAGASPEVQRAELGSLLDDLQSCGINAVIFQIRPECDALYDSPFEPWSYYLTGRQGMAPSPYYDPLQFAIAETHKRGMELHAWFNPYRAVRQVGAYSLSNKHVAMQHPDWLITIGTFRFLDPGLPMVREYVTQVILDVVRRYDVDGIHFDDYFYPYPPNGITNEDQKTFQQYSRGIMNIRDWRRDNVHQLIKGLHDTLQVVKPEVKFGMSPFGIWKNGVPGGIVGLSAYDEIYCDAVTWLEQKWIDYLTPQLYWKIGGPQDYSSLMSWWASKLDGRHLYTGNAAYRISSWTSREMPNQIRLNRAHANVGGEVFFRASMLQDNVLGFTDSLKTNLYRHPALAPVMAWKDAMPPSEPRQLRYERGPDGVMSLAWDPPLVAADGDTARRYAIYRLPHPPADKSDLEDPSRLLVITGLTHMQPKPALQTGTCYFVGTALDDNSNESMASSVVMITPPAVPQLAKPFNFQPGLASAVALSWQQSAVAAQYNLQVSTDSTFTRAMLVNLTLTDTTRLVNNLSGSTNYYWRVQALNPAGRSDFSETRVFRTSVPAAPLLAFPANNATQVELPVGLVWRAQTDSLLYQVQVSRSLNFDRTAMVADTTMARDTVLVNLGLEPLRIYFWRVRSRNEFGDSGWSIIWRFKTGEATLVADASTMPLRYRLLQNYPNPFNAVTTIPFELTAQSRIRLEVYDRLGRRVQVLLEGSLPAGIHTCTFDASRLSSGVYICRLRFDSGELIRRMTFMK